MAHVNEVFLRLAAKGVTYGEPSISMTIRSILW